MRDLARYAFSTDTTVVSLERICSLVETWITSKGSVSAPNREGVCRVQFVNGKNARWATERGESTSGRFVTWSLEEPTDGGEFSTRMGVAQTPSEVVFSTLLEAGATENVVAPVSIEARCPRVVRDVIALTDTWRVGNTLIAHVPLEFRGINGKVICGLISDPERSLPLIVVSEHDGLILHPGVTERLAKDVLGLAVVSQIDREASFQITSQLGKEWSCFNGAIRVYWPWTNALQNPFDHPLWTATKLLWGGVTTEFAAKKLCNMLRRKLMAISCFGIKASPLFRSIRREQNREIIDAKRKEAKQSSDWMELAEAATRENDELDRQNDALQERCDRLEADVNNLRLRLEWATRKPDLPGAEVEPEEETPVATVTEAVERARERFASLLIFGDDVTGGVNNLHPEAGPPEKIYHYLSSLSELTTARRAGTLRTTQLKWLEEHGVTCSSESDTIRNNKTEQRRRTWHDGTDRRFFEDHLKPSDATSPDRCVRIYFDWDKPSAKVIVGWVGRKPWL